ncbi:TPA: ribonuclease HI [Vibrio parahaemolyticus]|uniref:ribonuclease HI n=1 Tax=Vibrio parahaemolyticus TaxID=670 RepID=UPI00084BB690|nr:ribonuclease HI [Vibrio parahaemolyticus]EGQ7762843.1 ribonuclease HI [Vibrio alginolyticus]EGQ7766463.1 ribonuclease HI [Vibrio parahaemolyticus]EIV8666938.1 ribonuclease HI [Vibrio parahaemolyticus]MBE4207210.1 ribonuclease HI [Vibrio parahaemolyticus]MDF5330047.1 ribonuclease HI [Vibrio parahaemolyticus]
MSYSIYVDGAAPNNQHGCTRGGIGIAAFNEQGELEHQDSITIKRNTTNAELELMALIEGLEYAQDGDVIYSDSDFCVKGYNDWLDNWKERGWRKSDKKPVKNRHLWQQIDELRSKKYVEVFKVKAHSGDKGNDMADLLAVEAAEAD